MTIFAPCPCCDGSAEKYDGIPCAECDGFGTAETECEPITLEDLAEHCRVCDAPITSAELCAKCAVGNDPFFTADNCGADLR